MPQRVLLTGATGFVGSEILAELSRRGYAINALARRKFPQTSPNVQSFAGDVLDPAAIDTALGDCQAILHLVGILREEPRKGITFENLHVQATKNVIEAAGRKQVRRLVHMSSLGARPNAASRYHQTKWEAEQLVRASGLDWTILRPSLISGPQGGFTKMQIDWAKGKSPPYLFMPYFGSGLLGLGRRWSIQPILVQDVARAFVDCLENQKTIGKTYDLAGPDRITWPEYHRLISRALLGKPRLTLPIPVWYAQLLTHILPPTMLPFNRDQIVLSQEDNIADLVPFVQDFAWTPRPLAATLSSPTPT